MLYQASSTGEGSKTLLVAGVTRNTRNSLRVSNYFHLDPLSRPNLFYFFNGQREESYSPEICLTNFIRTETIWQKLEESRKAHWQLNWRLDQKPCSEVLHLTWEAFSSWRPYGPSSEAPVRYWNSIHRNWWRWSYSAHLGLATQDRHWTRRRANLAGNESQQCVSEVWQAHQCRLTNLRYSRSLLVTYSYQSSWIWGRTNADNSKLWALCRHFSHQALAVPKIKPS